MISKFDVSLVRIDTKYPVGEKNDEFVKLVNNLKPDSELLIAEVGVEDFDPYKNKDLAQRYGVKKEDFPSLKLFINGNTDKAISFDADFKFTDILSFIKKNSKIQIHLKHCIQELDKIAAKFSAKGVSKDKQKKLLKELQKKAKSLTDENDKKSSEVYLKIMEKVVERGTKFVESEEQRVLNILNGKISETKRTGLVTRLNIIQSFKQ